jgi:hypothetical protein
MLTMVQPVYCRLLVPTVLSVQPAFTVTIGDKEEEKKEEEEVSCHSQHTTHLPYLESGCTAGRIYC